MNIIGLTNHSRDEISMILRIHGEFYRVAAEAKDGKLTVRIDDSEHWTTLAQCAVELAAAEDEES